MDRERLDLRWNSPEELIFNASLDGGHRPGLKGSINESGVHGVVFPITSGRPRDPAGSHSLHGAGGNIIE
ncbi:hypothetical protein I7I53_03091 [Histoplasma capsulatum var. duboisii H88]|uniref:Uncharacterized protein n=1 Tax=Ajellomyces capsulatus (strain H88) TaxID=544711 RepID=A0A8A1LMS3_AJEC8|nr:hypothetical protein I7I53_03091 [Histoplasma capsulatum var. duboisii H88]